METEKPEVKTTENRNSAEFMERRVLAKRNPPNPPEGATQSVPESESGLERVRAKAKKDSHLKFNNLFHHLTPKLLMDAYFKINKHAAKGVDGMGWRKYGEKLVERLADLHARLHQGRYKPHASLRIWIPKADGNKRPLGIASLEDKIVQQALVWILEAIYEVDFLGFSYGFRPNRGAHNALDAVYVAITQKKVSWVFDADIKGFFDNLNHGWLMRFIEHRVSDKRVLDLIKKILAAGVTENGKWSKTEVGTPQGAVISPLLANIYLHYVLDLWVHRWRRKFAKGEVYIIRYADDFVVEFQLKSDAVRFQTELETRLQGFSLNLHPDKTRLIEFGRFARQNRKERGEGIPETFNFLGFTHICDQRLKDGGFKLRRSTISKKLRSALNRVKSEIKKVRCQEIHLQGEWLNRVVNGFYNYFGVPGNWLALDAFRTEVNRSWLKSLRRRSQKGEKLNWVKFTKLVKHYIPKVRYTHPYPNMRFPRLT